MKLIERSSVLFKTLITLTGFCVLMMCWAGKARAQYPSASFTSNVFSGCAPLSVDFTNLSTQATNYFWDFGNGNVSSLQDPTTVYLSSGFYTVTLIAINNLTGNRDTLVATNYIQVINDPVADFSASPLSACAGNNSIAFTNLSSNANSYIWDFGDGNFSVQTNPVHTYTNPGVYTVKLIAQNAFGCNKIIIKNSYITIFQNSDATFTVSPQSSCNVNEVFNFACTTPGTNSWQWDFGDGTTSNLQNPSHIYGAQGSYTISLIVFTPDGCSDTTVLNNHVNIGPNLVPSFTVNNQGGCVPFTADFACTVANATSWLWDFGDGNTSTQENPSHTYSTPGNYDITLTVTTSIGCNGTVTLPAYITVDPLPIAAFTVNDPVGCSPHTTFFTNTSLNSTTWLWDFGDGTTSTDQNPFHTFTDTGSYTVTLTAYSPNGCSATVVQPGAVTTSSITANLTGSPRAGCAPLPVNFTGSSTPAGVSWQWDFGDGTTGTGQTISHSYTAIGNYIVSLIVTSASGCIDTITRNNFIRVFDDSTNYIVPDTILVCTPPGVVSFTDPTMGSNSWLWDFGDGNTSTVKNPTHTYLIPGVYTVTLTANMAGGCSQTFNPYAIINVVPFLVSPITSLITSPCGPYTVQLNNATLNIVSYLWDFGDGTTSTLQNPVHTYALPGTYTVSLLMVSVNGCQTSLTTTVTFGYQNPITVSDTTTCLGDTILFGLNPASAFISASWNFGDGTGSSLIQPTHIYAATGTYTISVTATDTNGCVYTFNYPNIVYVSDPLASFTINQPQSGCVPYEVQFINNSTGANGYYWYFGDGNNSTLASPSYIYTIPGVYTVQLNAAKKGCVRSLVMTNYITVNEAVAGFSLTPDSGCIPLPVVFTDLSINAVSWMWDFGDGSTSVLQNPVHSFTSQPSSGISLVIIDSNGCTDTVSAPAPILIVPDIQVSDTNACSLTDILFSTTLNAVSYLWNFGDGTTSSQQNPVHQYTQSGTYTVSLTCVLASGCTAVTTSPGLISVSAPVSAFMSPTVAICAPSLVNFINQSTGSTSWLWDFGDGTSSSSENPSHIYNVPGSYTVSLIAYSDSGCSDTLTLIDYITVPGTLTEFTLAGIDFCANSIVQFTDQSINASNWFWNFGDGSTSTQQNPVHIYTVSGSYTVTLITTDSVGCSSFFSFPDPITINPNPAAQAQVSPVAGCLPLTSVFTNSSTGSSTYTWNFGNGITSGATDTSYTYTIPGIYYPYLVAITSFGCTDTFVYAPGIAVSGLPSPDFTANFNSNCAPATVAFINNSTSLLNPSYSWNFGNGQTSTQVTPSVVYNLPGVYQVSLIVSNAGGCSDTIIKPVTILAAPLASATTSGNSGCAPYPVSFTNTSVNAASYFWDFGDGTSSSATDPTHLYTISGNYSVTLIAINSNGCADTLVLPLSIQVNQTPVANFTRSPASGCAPVNVILTSTSTQLTNPVYSWNFGNGQSGNQPAHTINYPNPGTYAVSLIVTNGNGCSDTIIKNVIANPAPEALATASGFTGCAPYSVSFNNMSFNATTYNWNFGDGNSGNQQSPTHIYANPGDYTVTLIVGTAQGCTDTLIFSNPVHVDATPVISITPSLVTGCTPAVITFTKTESGLVNPVYAWNFDNGQTATTAQGSVTYSSAGNYNPTLIVTNQGGCSDTASTSITINDTPVASASTADTAGCAPYLATFTSSSQNGNNYLWNFGDGTTSLLMNPTHLYAVAGTYPVSVIVMGIGGCSDTLELPKGIHVKATPEANLSPLSVTGCTPLTVNFTNSSTGLVSPAYLWNFGNGTQSSQSDPQVIYSAAGTFPVSLLVSNSEGCTDTASATVTANISPVALAAPFDTSGCTPHTVNFASLSTNTTTLSWNFGDGTISSQPNVQHIYNSPGLYQPYLVASTNSGCTDTLLLSAVNVYPNPVAAFTVNQTALCSGSQFIFTNQSTPVTGLTYQWNIAGISYTIASPSVPIIAPGIYDVSLIVTNQFGCTDTLLQPNYIQVYDTLPPPVSPILSVSVLSNTSVEIIWENNAALDLGAYVLYRYNPLTGVFDEIYRDNTPNNSTMNITSTYVDAGLNTLNTVYTYKLSTLDRCSYSLPLSAVTAHTTINVSAVPVGNNVRVNWTRYFGCPVAAYEINRVNIASGLSTLVATVPPSTLTYLDQGFYCPDEYSYRITATALCGNAYTSLSDTANATPANMLAAQKVEVVRSTVINDRDVLTEWLPPVLAPERVIQFNVLRSTDNVSFTEIASLPATSFSYIDYNADVHHQEYYYRVEIINDCQVAGSAGNNSSSILLKSDWQDERTKLWWTPYLNWDTGVDYYIIEKENNYGQWLPLKTIDGNEINTVVDE